MWSFTDPNQHLINKALKKSELSVSRYIHVTWLVVTEVQSTSFGLVLHAHIVLQILLIFSPPEGYRFPFHVHILCIRYGTVLTNTAVQCTHLCIGCWPVCGALLWVLLQHSITLQRVFFIIKCGIACFLCTMHVFEVRVSSSSPRLPLCQISFLSRPPLIS